MDITQRIAVKALIVDDNKILILREASTYDEGTQLGRYHLPGGRVEIGEPFETALHREVREESGLKVIMKYPLYVGEWHPVIKGKQNQIIAIFFVCQPITREVTLSNEHDDFQWIELGKSTDYDIVEPEDKVIERYIAWQNKTVASL